MRAFRSIASPFRTLWLSLWINRGLIWSLSTREIAGRYRGAMLGMFWSFLNPLLMLAVYTFVFTEVFRMRWTSDGTSTKLQFAIALFSGQLVFALFSECMSRAPGLIVANPNYVKKVVFPLEIFPWVTLLTALFHFIVGLLVLVGVILFAGGAVPLSALLLPVVLVPFLLFCGGLTWLLSAIGVYVRDIGQVLGIVVNAMLFLSPVFYPLTAVPAAYRWLAQVNPLTFPIETTRQLILFRQLPNPTALSAYAVACLIVAAGGLWIFARVRKGFSDVL